MALASLCAQVQKDKSSRERYHFTAMIVDHGVRSGSLTEAQVTAKTVQKLGEISTQVDITQDLD